MKAFSRLLPIIPCMAASAIAAPLVAERKLSDTTYELTVTVPGTTEVGDAQRLLLADAKRVCGAKPFHFGHYTFDSTKRLDEATPELPRLTLVQEVECETASAGSEQDGSYAFVPTEADNDLVTRRTTEFLGQKDQGKLTAAYAQFSDAMKQSARFDSWSRSVQEFNEKAGGVQFRKITRVSWVKDPPDAPPGHYAAVDYTGRFENVAFVCGYVAWFRDRTGALSIMREEENFIDDATRSRISPDAVVQVLRQFGCVSG